MKEFWDERFADETYIYGVEPNDFFAQQLSALKAGRILLPGEGEGRNAVWAAKQGWMVDAVDYSVVAKTKAAQLAGKHKVKINYQISALETFEPEANTYDAIGLVFVHLQPEEREILHRKLIKALRPGGVIILEAFSVNQINKQSGGPKNIRMLYDIESLASDFGSITTNYFAEETIQLSEGQHHMGEASVIRLAAIKPF